MAQINHFEVFGTRPENGSAGRTSLTLAQRKALQVNARPALPTRAQRAKIDPKLLELKQQEEENKKVTVIVTMGSKSKVASFVKLWVRELEDREGLFHRVSLRASQGNHFLKLKRLISKQLFWYVFDSLRLTFTIDGFIPTRRIKELRIKINTKTCLWLARALVVELPLKDIWKLSEPHWVLYVEPQESGFPPDTVTPTLVDVEEENAISPPNEENRSSAAYAGAHIDGETYLEEPDLLTGFRIALLDSGLDPHNRLLERVVGDRLFLNEISTDEQEDGIDKRGMESHPEKKSGRWASALQSVIGPLVTASRYLRELFKKDVRNLMQKTEVVDDLHGTKSAILLVGNDPKGAYRGVTEMDLYSFRVFTKSLSTDGLAVCRAFQSAIENGCHVILAELEGPNNPNSFIAQVANRAFDAGVVVIATNGNNGHGFFQGDRRVDLLDPMTFDPTKPFERRPMPHSVNAPAIAHKVIGVGAFEVNPEKQFDDQGRGSAPDGRIKPDIQAPTNTMLPGIGQYGGTSGAAPYAAGAALLLCKRIWKDARTYHPGYVYANLILCGDQSYAGEPPPQDGTEVSLDAWDGFSNTIGAGRLQLLPLRGVHLWGQVSIRDSEEIDIPLEIPDVGYGRLDAALWWPENPDQSHNEVHLSLIAPPDPDKPNSQDIVRHASTSRLSVFQRAQVKGDLETGLKPGTWTLRIRGENVRRRFLRERQQVFWAAHARLRKEISEKNLPN